MAREIERKFLVRTDAWRGSVLRSAYFRQGYVAGSARCSVRVRIADNSAWLALKSPRSGRTRLEFEYTIPREDAVEMLDSFDGACIEKTRHWLAHADHTWEVDEFLGDNAGLLVAEIELTHEAEEFVRPPWLGMEVTEDRRYYNFNLATFPWCRWPGVEKGRP
jgi:adenylate cyclase